MIQPKKTMHYNFKTTLYQLPTNLLLGRSSLKTKHIVNIRTKILFELEEIKM